MAQISIRRSTPADLDHIIAIVKQAKALLKADGSPQWQDGHPVAKLLSTILPMALTGY